MEAILEMTMAVRQYHIDVYKQMNQLTRDMTALQFNFIEQLVFRGHHRLSARGTCDYAEKGLTCAMPL